MINWLPVAAYLALALMAGRCARRLPVGPQADQWQRASALLAGLAGLAALQTLQVVVPMLRGLAQAQGWYAGRRAVQAPVLLVAAAALAVLWRRRPPSDRVLAGAMAVLGGLAVLRLVSLHHTDAWLDARGWGWPRARWVEAGGLAVVVCQAVRIHALPRPSLQEPPHVQSTSR